VGIYLKIRKLPLSKKRIVAMRVQKSKRLS